MGVTDDHHVTGCRELDADHPLQVRRALTAVLLDPGLHVPLGDVDLIRWKHLGMASVLVVGRVGIEPTTERL
jgi:hypothetical protein